MIYTFKYRCRACGEVFGSTGTSNADLVLAVLSELTVRDCSARHGNPVSRIDIHSSCSAAHLGLGDLIGVKEES